MQTSNIQSNIFVLPSIRFHPSPVSALKNQIHYYYIASYIPPWFCKIFCWCSRIGTSWHKIIRHVFCFNLNIFAACARWAPYNNIFVALLCMKCSKCYSLCGLVSESFLGPTPRFSGLGLLISCYLLSLLDNAFKIKD
jgi:hypothetical protein